MPSSPAPGEPVDPAAEPDEPSVPLWRSLLLPSLFLLIAMLNLTLPVVGLKELILDRLGGTTADASLFFTVEMLAYILFAPLWGLLSDRWGKRKPLVVLGFLLSAPLYASYAHAPSVPVLLALRFVQGALTIAAWSTLMALVVDQAGAKRRGRAMGVMGGALSLGVSFGVPIGGYLSRDHGSTAPVHIAAVLFLAIGLGSLALAESRRLAHQPTWREITTALARQPRLLLPYLFYFVDRYTVGFFVVLFPLYLGSLGIADPAVKGRYLALFLLPFALLQPLAGRLAERTGPWALLIGGSLAYGLLLSTVGFAGLSTLWWVMLGLGVLAALMFTPALVLAAQASSAETRASAMGGFNLAGSLGFAFGPLVGAWAFQARGYGFAFVVAGGLEVACALVGLVLARRWALMR